MSGRLSGDLSPAAGGAGGPVFSALRRCATTVVYAFKRLTRPIQSYGVRPWRIGFPWFDDPLRLAMGAAIVVALVVAGMIFVDAAAANATHQLAHNVVLFFDWITDFGKSGWFLWPLGILFLVLAALPQHLSAMSRGVLAALMVRVGFLFVAIGAPGLFASIVKNMIGRARPGVGGSVNPYLFDPFHWTPAYASLPSGHGTAAFAVLAAFATLFPRARTVLLIYALLILASRVVVRAHYPTDVALGALTGLIGVLLVRRWFALQRLGFSISAGGQLVPYPGPSLRRLKSVARELLA